MRAQSVAAAYFAVRSASPVVADLRATAQLAAALGCVGWMGGVDAWTVEWMDVWSEKTSPGRSENTFRVG